ncbi:MAG: hypothetical protein ABIN58_05710 [candidate division WOR-3 bacterium]
MVLRHQIARLFRIFLVLTVMCFLGILAVFVHSYYLGNYFDVHVFHDPRWRVFNFNSRQASEGEIYNVAEIPSIRRARLSGKRRLLIEFIPPINTPSWTVMNMADGTVITKAPNPEVQFRDSPHVLTCRFIPEGLELQKEIILTFHFYPAENYRRFGLSWDDNYHVLESSVPFSLKKAYSIDEWAGIPDDDPELVEAKRILETVFHPKASTIERAEQVFCFVMGELQNAAGPRTDAIQEASPLDTYRLMSSGRSGGACENTSLVYYLFANAAGIRTRLVDIGGKFGPLKLTGHHFCEIWIPEEATWCYVDPQAGIASMRSSEGKPLNFLEVKRVYDLGFYRYCTVRKHDPSTGELMTQTADESGGHYFRGDIVVAYRFGHGRNKSFSPMKDFLTHTTLLYAPFGLPKKHLLKFVFLYGFFAGLGLTLISGCAAWLLRRKKRTP